MSCEDVLLSSKRILTPELRKANSLSLFSNVIKEYSKLENVPRDAKNRTSVPVLAECSISFNDSTVSPFSNRAEYFFPSRHITNSNQSERAFTTDTPTPCNPPETL